MLRPWRWALVLAVAVALLLPLDASATDVVGPSHPARTLGASEAWTPTNAPLPTVLPNGNAPVEMLLEATSCTSADWCISVGHVQDSQRNAFPLVETLADGVWTPSIPSLPTNASNPFPPDPAQNLWGANLTSVSCAAQGECEAVGIYYSWDTTAQVNFQNGLLESLGGGVWTPQEAALPDGPDSGLVNLNSVSCPATTTCFAVGVDFSFPPSMAIGLLYEWNGSTWVFSTLPATSDLLDNYSVNAISCVDASDCEAVGSYSSTIGEVPGAGGPTQGLILTLADGTWSAATAPDAPNANATDPEAQLQAVSCPAVGACVAVGFSSNADGNQEPLLVEQAGGVWSAQAGPVPQDAQSNPIASMDSVDCPSVGLCLATGAYWVDYDVDQSGMILDLSNGTWSASSAPLPTTTQALVHPATHRGGAAHRGTHVARALDSSTSISSLQGVSCAPQGVCHAVGTYDGSLGLIESGALSSIAPVTLSKISPTWGTPAGTQVTVTGTNFLPGSVVDVGGDILPTTVLDAEHLSATVPPGVRLGSSPVSVSASGASYTNANVTFTTANPPTITLSNASGVIGHRVVRVSGTSGTGQSDVAVTVDECATPVFAATTCDADNAATTTTSTTGAFKNAAISVTAGTVDPAGDTCGLATSNPCYVVASTPWGASGAVALSFRSPVVKLGRISAVGGTALSIRAQHFPAGDTLEAEECRPGAVASAVAEDCDPGTAESTTAGAGGSATFPAGGLLLLAGDAYSDPGGGSCDPGATCTIVVTDEQSSSVAVVAAVGVVAPSATVTQLPATSSRSALVKVLAKGFPSGTSVQALECDSAYAGVADDSVDCDVATTVEGTANAAGKVTWSGAGVVLVTSASHPPYADASSPPATCAPGDTVASGDPCFVAVVDTTNPAFSVSEPING